MYYATLANAPDLDGISSADDFLVLTYSESSRTQHLPVRK